MSRLPGLRPLLVSLAAVLGVGSLTLAQAPAPTPAAPAPVKQAPAKAKAAKSPAQAAELALNEPPAPKVRTPEDEARRKQVLARVEGVEITVAKVEDFLDQQAPLMRVRYQDPAELKKLVDNMVRFELLAAEAERRGYDKNKVVVRTLKDGAVQNLLRSDIEEKITTRSITDEEVSAYYTANAAEFHRDAARRASHILVETEAEAKQLLVQAQKVDAQGFNELAKKHSKDLETKLRGGDLGFFAKAPGEGAAESNVPEAVRKAVFEIKNVGDAFSKPVVVEGGFSLVRLTGERPERHVSLHEAEQQIRTKLWRERRQKALTDLVDGLRAKEKPQVFADKVDLVKLDDMDKQPGGFAPGPANKQAGAEDKPHKNPHQ